MVSTKPIASSDHWQLLPCAAIAVQRGSEFLNLFVTVSFLKVRVRARALKGMPIRIQRPP